MRGTFRTALAALLAFACTASPAAATSRIKDLANIEGVRQNQLIGYGLVVGLAATGLQALTRERMAPRLREAGQGTDSCVIGEMQWA